jgi:NAD dependent epimerase/dehydratase
MKLNNKKILVTGADGFIGSHLTESLVRLGCKVKAFVQYNSYNSWGWLDYSPPEILENLEVFTGDIRDPHGVKTSMVGCDLVIHLAALIAIPYSYCSPNTYVDTNITGTLNLLQAAKDLGVNRFIHTSTSEVYGTAQYVPIDESHPLQAQSPYSATKIAADALAMSFYNSFQIPVTVARPFNTYGPRQSARAVIPTIIAQIANGVKEIKLGDVTPTRDFNYVTDTCRGVVALASSSNTIGEIVNIGSNFEISIGDTLNMIKELMGTDVEFIFDKQRLRPEKSEVFRLWCDNTKIEHLTGFKPKVKIREGLQRTIEWFVKRENLRMYKSDIYNV